MLDFEYQNTTKIVFGKGRHREIGALLRSSAQKVLFHYGGGSIKRSGLYDDVVASLRENGIDFAELSGVSPNPTYELVQKGIELCRKENIGHILAVGGGSVLDSAKAIAMGVPYAADVWDFFTKENTPHVILPVTTILTLPAAGSEQSPDSVITRGGHKICAIYPKLRPQLSIINPELFYTLPKNQIANGICDMLCHVMERYFSKTEHTEYITGLCESTMRTIISSGKKVMENSSDYNAWSDLALAGSYGHTGFLGSGRTEDWACHGIEHAISGKYPQIAHGAGLAVLYPKWMQYVHSEHPEIFIRFAKNVMGVSDTQSAIAELREYFSYLGLPKSMTELGIDESEYESLAKAATHYSSEGETPLGNMKKLYSQDIVKIFEQTN